MGVGTRTAVATVLVVAGYAGSARAGCNVIPEIPPSFRGVRGSVDRPFVRAGARDRITIDLRSGEGRERVATVSDIDVTVIIKPVGRGKPRTLFIPGDGRCESFREEPCCLQRLFCGAEPDCIDAGPAGADAQLLATADGHRLNFRVPDSKLSGPLTLVVTAANEPAPKEFEKLRCRDVLEPEAAPRPDILACVDELLALDPAVPRVSTMAPSPTPGPLPGDAALAFTQLMVLPSSNDFQTVCDDDAGDLPHCRGTSKHLNITVDSIGDLYIPMRWRNILRLKDDGLTLDKRQVRCSSAVQPFADHGGRIAVPSAAFLESWTPVGTAFGSAPVFIPQQLPDRPKELTLFGTTDQDDSVLRIRRRRLWRNACDAGVNAGQACEPAPQDDEAIVDCPEAQCAAQESDAYYVCVGGQRDTLPCTRPHHCPGGKCRAAGKCLLALSDAGTGRDCLTDAQCDAGEECGRGLFEFRNRTTTNGVVEFPRSANSDFPGVCDAGNEGGKPCKSSAACNPLLFGKTRCVGYRAEAILFVP